MPFEAHSLMVTRFVSHETPGHETQNGLPCVDEPQGASVALAGGAAVTLSGGAKYGPAP